MIFYQIPFSFVPYRVSMKWQLTGDKCERNFIVTLRLQVVA